MAVKLKWYKAQGAGRKEGPFCSRTLRLYPDIGMFLIGLTRKQ